jgi:hypothetical protein
METPYHKFKVVSISTNTNSFGLFGVIIMNQQGHAYELGVSSFNLADTRRSDIVHVKLRNEGQQNEMVEQVYEFNFEIPRRLTPDAPPDVIEHVWKARKKRAAKTRSK